MASSNPAHARRMIAWMSLLEAADEISEARHLPDTTENAFRKIRAATNFRLAVDEFSAAQAADKGMAS